MSERDCEKDTESVSTKEVQDSPAVKAREGPKVFLDSGEERVRYKKSWWQIWYVASPYFNYVNRYAELFEWYRLPKDPPPPAPPSLEDAPVRHQGPTSCVRLRLTRKSYSCLDDTPCLGLNPIHAYVLVDYTYDGMHLHSTIPANLLTTLVCV